MKARTVTLALVATLAATTLLFTATVVQSNEPRDWSSDEPAHALPATSPVTVQQGETPEGVPWETVEYETRAGWLCVDFWYDDSPDEGDDRSMVGGCFFNGGQETGRVRGQIPSTGEWAVVGVLEGPKNGTGTSRDIWVRLTDGQTVRLETTEHGSFAGVTQTMPTGIIIRTVQGREIDLPWETSPNQEREARSASSREQ